MEKIFCNQCGEELDASAKFCKNCGTELVEESNQNKFCSNCGVEMDSNAKFCPECGHPTNGVQQKTGAAAVNQPKSPLLALILSFLIVGLGQIYLGLIKKGLLLIFAAIISAFLTLIYIGFILWVIVWIYAMYDAYNSAEKINNGIEVKDTIDFNNL